MTALGSAAMRILSWNVNGLRSISRKGSLSIIKYFDVVMLQEIRTTQLPLDVLYMGFEIHGFPAVRKGYSGVLTLTRIRPIRVLKGIGIADFDEEGRVLTLELNEAYLVNAYFPRAGDNLERLEFKLRFDKAFEDFIQGLKSSKPIIMCGDFNAVYSRSDSSFWDEQHPGLTPRERAWLRRVVEELGYIDTYRLVHPRSVKYTWRSYRYRGMAMRIDYCMVSSELAAKVRDADIIEVEGSDHYPVTLTIDI